MKNSSILHCAVAAALLSLTTPAPAAEPLDPHEADPIDPSSYIREASADLRLSTAGLPLQGRVIEINARLRAVTEVPSIGDPIYYPMPETVPVRWTLSAYPGRGDVGAEPSFQTSRAQAFLSLPRTGDYTVTYTVCPDGPVNVRLGTRFYDIPTHTDTITINSVVSMPVRPERNPLVPAFLRHASPYMNLTAGQLDNICGDGQPSVVRPRWVTARGFNGGQPNLTTVEGSVVTSWISDDDEWRTHRSNDVRVMIRPDPAYHQYMLPEPGNPSPQMLVAWERASLPERFCPLSGDRISVIGILVHDCLDSAHRTQIHPPAGIAVHRQRPVPIPSVDVFTWALPGGPLQSSAGNNVYVPGVITDVWFNKNAGGILGTGEVETQYGLARPNDFNSNGAHVSGPLPIDALHVVNIALPRSPARRLGEWGQAAPPAPLYVKISRPWNHDPPLTRFERHTDSEGEEYLKVFFDLRGYGGATYTCRVEAAWVYPDPDNWSLEQWQVNLRRLIIHNDRDPDYSLLWWAAGDFRLFCGLPVADQGWSRLLDGDENSYTGTPSWTPNWITGAGDDVTQRPLGTVDPLRRLGTGVLVYREDGSVPFWMHGFESDVLYDDTIGRLYTRLHPDTTRTARAMLGANLTQYGHYSVEVQTARQPGLPGGAVLSPAASALVSYYVLQGQDTSPAATAPPAVYDPAEEHSTLAEGVADGSFWVGPGANMPGANEGYGREAAIAGDLNGDGLAEVAVMVESGGSSEVRIFAGGGRWLDPEPLAIIPPPAGAGKFGFSIAPVGDVTGDGIPDLLIGDPRFSNGQMHEGAVFLYDGKTLRDGGTAPLWHRESDEAESLFGWSVASGGPGGFIAGAPAAKPAAGRKGKGKVEYMQYELSNTIVTSFRPTDDEGDQAYGTSVASAGDLDGDGVEDFLVGAPEFHRTHLNEGAVYIYSGRVLDPGHTPPPPVVLPGGQAGALFGTCVAGLGDTNGDGLSDFAAGAPGALAVHGTGSGAVSLFAGSSSSMVGMTPAWTKYSDIAGSEMGFSVAGLGDLNSDGLADIGVSEPGYDGGTIDMGRATIFLGKPAGRGSVPVETWCEHGVTGFAHVAPRFRAASDVNGDGFSDTVMDDPCGGCELTEHVRLRPGRGNEPVQPSAHPYFDGPPDLPGSLTDFDDPAGEQETLAYFTAHPDDARLLLDELLVQCKKLPPGTAAQSEFFRSLRETRAVMPAALWAQYFGGVDLTAGASWMIDCGSAADSTDALGRFWYGDTPFLVAPSGYTLVHPTCSDTRLTDRHIPSTVLCSERLLQNLLHYRVPVYDGPCRVILYFAESKAAVVGPERGGTAAPGTRHTVDVEIQGVRTNGFDIADHAAGNPADNIGALHTAVEFVQRSVIVTGGYLDIKVHGQAPGGAVIRAICVFQEPAMLTDPGVELFTNAATGDRHFCLGTGNASALLMAGQYLLSAERSPDLLNWFPLTNPSWSDARACWLLPPQTPPQRRQFFRGGMTAP